MACAVGQAMASATQIMLLMPLALLMQVLFSGHRQQPAQLDTMDTIATQWQMAHSARAIRDVMAQALPAGLAILQHMLLGYYASQAAGLRLSQMS